LLLCGCVAPAVVPAPSRAPAVASIYLVSHGGHSGIVISRADIPEGLWPESRDFPTADYLEVGWGDRDFYQSPAPGPWITFKAAFLPTASVLHVVGFRGAPAEYFRDSEIVEIPLPRSGTEGLARYIHDAYLRAGVGATAPLGPGLYGDSRFYPGRETFHILRNCNVWTAGALRAAGLPVRDAITREGLMSQVRALGTVVQSGAP
jgi:uncharacterized protein (TIGR02117 family)